MTTATMSISQANARKGNATPSSVVLDQEMLSDLVIPAVPGEYYAYSYKFVEERPLYALMKCRANKGRSIAAASDLGHEANLLFLFGNPNRTQICAIREACVRGLLGESVDIDRFGETWIAPAKITVEEFYEIRSQKNVPELVKICQATCSEHKVSLELKPDVIVAMMSDSGKCGLFSVKEITSSSIQIDACHILLL